MPFLTSPLIYVIAFLLATNVIAGIGWVTHDIAGFSGGPSTKELYLRWLELGRHGREREWLPRDEGEDDDDDWDADDDCAKRDARLTEEFNRLTMIVDCWRCGAPVGVPHQQPVSRPVEDANDL